MFLFTLYFVFETYFLSPSRTTTPFWTLFSLRCSVSSTRTSFKSSWRTFPSFSHLIPRGSNHVLYYAVALLGPFVSHDHLLEMRNYLSKVREELNNKEAANPVNSFVCLKHLLFYKSLSCDPNRSCICCSFQSDTSLARLLCRLSAASFSTVDKLDSDVFTLIDRSRSEFSTRMALPRASLSSSGRSTASLFSEMEREKRTAAHAQAQLHGVDEDHQRIRRTDRRQRTRTDKTPHNERIGQIIKLLEYIAKHKRHGKDHHAPHYAPLRHDRRPHTIMKVKCLIRKSRLACLFPMSTATA